MMSLNQKIMSIENLKLRFKIFAIEVANLIKGIKSNTINNAYCNQLIRSSSSSAANYYAACRGKSKADFINKLKIVEEELDESVFFLDLLQHFNEDKFTEIEKLKNEGTELLAIIVKSIVTTRNNLKK
jgi:four helix bundle protein